MNKCLIFLLVCALGVSLTKATTSCDAGQYLESDGETCTPCDVGETSTAGSTACTACPAGSVGNNQDSPFTGSTNCILCQPGTFAPTPGIRSCILCPADTWSPFAGATFCNKCPPDTTRPFTSTDGCLMANGTVLTSYPEVPSSVFSSVNDSQYSNTPTIVIPTVIGGIILLTGTVAFILYMTGCIKRTSATKGPYARLDTTTTAASTT